MTKTILFGKTIAITLFAAAFLGLMIPNVEANDGENNPACFSPVGIELIFDPNTGLCVPPADCEFGVDNTTNPPHCNSPPAGDDDDDDDDDNDDDDEDDDDDDDEDDDEDDDDDD